MFFLFKRIAHHTAVLYLATSKTWSQTLGNPGKPGPWKTWTQKNLDPGKPGPRKTWIQKNLDPEKHGSRKTWSNYGVKKYS